MESLLIEHQKPPVLRKAHKINKYLNYNKVDNS